jgi:hypothetical protein
VAQAGGYLALHRIDGRDGEVARAMGAGDVPNNSGDDLCMPLISERSYMLINCNCADFTLFYQLEKMISVFY